MPAVSFLAEDPIRRAVDEALAALVAGTPVSSIEHDRIDFKEDPSHRGPRGEFVTPGPGRVEKAALYLADEAACMSNSGGGALIIGVEDATGAVLGTNLDAMWLRGRVHDLSERRLTCAVEEVTLTGKRLLVIISPPAQEPIRVRGRAKHRVGGRCVEIDASQWMATHMRRLGFDWSAQPSHVSAARVRAAAVEVARRYLRASDEDHATELASAEPGDILRRLDALHGDELTNGAALLFTAEAGRALVDYRRRELPGGDSLLRLDRPDVSLLEAFAEVEQAIALTNRTVHVRGPGLVVGQIRALPENTVREALANAIAHRDWGLRDPIDVEFVGDALVVQSPGGFVEGVDPSKLLTTPPRTRNPHLADLLRRLRVAEREGVGVDRMYREMIRLGHQPPSIVELSGPHVRCTLVGGDPNTKVLRFLAALEPSRTGDDLDISLIVDTLRSRPTIRAEDLAGVLQKPVVETVAALRRASGATFRGAPLIEPTLRTQRHRSPEYRLGEPAATYFGTDLPYYRTSREAMVGFVVDFVRTHGQIRSSDYVELFAVSQPHAARILRDLASPEWGEVLRPGRVPNRGRDAHYVAGAGFPSGGATPTDR